MNEAFQSALNVLLVEDDKELAGFVKQGLEDESCIVTAVHDGGSGLRQAEIHAFDIIVMDVMMPVLNGFEVTKRLRLQKVRTPILLLTARDAPEDIVKGLDAGADDYLTKPFEFEVLLARIGLGRGGATGQERGPDAVCGSVSGRRKARGVRAGQRLDLTRTEFGILECLMRAAGRVVTRGPHHRPGLGRPRREREQSGCVYALSAGEGRSRWAAKAAAYRARAGLLPERRHGLKNLTIQARLTAWYLLSLAIIVGLFAGGSWYAMRASMYHSIDRDLGYRLGMSFRLSRAGDWLRTSSLRKSSSLQKTRR